MSEGSPIANVLVAGSGDALDANPRRTLDSRDIELLTDISARLMKSPTAKSLPDVMSFAFWCRRGHLNALAKARADLASNLGRGLALHVTPSNVPVNFAFSWAFALLAGNANIVRVPSRPFPQIEVICDAIGSAMVDAGDERSAFVLYDSASSTTEELSRLSDVRVLWGGDTTVSLIRAMTSKPRCVDIAFADRYSIALIDSAVIAELSESKISRLADAFYNDTYLMDQNACSSPMTVAWLGGDAVARKRFWSAVRNRAVSGYDLQGAVATEKYVQLCSDAMDGSLISRVDFDGWLDVVSLDRSSIKPGTLGSYRGKGGYFYEIELDEVANLAPLLSQSCQTVTYFGVDPQVIRASVLDSGLQGVDRIVPIGKAMDIDIVWDGMDLLSMMSRKVDVR